jgi:hypothetical protein
MRRLIFSAILAVLFQSNAFPATGGKGAASHASAQSSRSPAAASGTTRSGGGGGGMARAPDSRKVPPLAEDRKISEQDCSKPIDWSAGNLKCK